MATINSSCPAPYNFLDGWEVSVGFRVRGYPGYGIYAVPPDIYTYTRTTYSLPDGRVVTREDGPNGPWLWNPGYYQPWYPTTYGTSAGVGGDFEVYFLLTSPYGSYSGTISSRACQVSFVPVSDLSS